MVAMVTWKKHLNRAVRHLGSQKRLADAIGCSQAKISWLLLSADKIDAEDAVAIDRATGSEVSKSQLRPDIFEPESASA
jgi:DNA-binding transcriptional regulator YdaS (Cro superfamily)